MSRPGVGTLYSRIPAVLLGSPHPVAQHGKFTFQWKLQNFINYASDFFAVQEGMAWEKGNLK
jgi:hypothetical protein